MKALSIIGIIGFSITFLVGCTYLSSYDSGQNAAAAWDTIAGMYGLATIRHAFEAITGSWNGEDEHFMADGDTYHEEHAAAAQEIVKAVDALQAMLNDFVEL